MKSRSRFHFFHFYSFIFGQVLLNLPHIFVYSRPLMLGRFRSHIFFLLFPFLIHHELTVRTILRFCTQRAQADKLYSPCIHTFYSDVGSLFYPCVLVVLERKLFLVRTSVRIMFLIVCPVACFERVIFELSLLFV